MKNTEIAELLEKTAAQWRAKAEAASNDVEKAYFLDYAELHAAKAREMRNRKDGK